jgi:hypothetical protein
MARRRPALPLPTIARKQSDYTTRTGRCTRAATIAAQALADKPVFLEDAATGFRVRQWKAAELRSFTQADIAHALTRCRVVEVAELLGDIPISAIKNAIYKGWIVKDSNAGFYHVTRLAQLELGLPKKDRNGCTIRFLDNGLARGEPSIAKVDRELAPLLPNVPFTA